MKECGEDVVIGPCSTLAGLDHFHIGSHVYIGPGAVWYSTIAEIYVGNYVNFGPNVTIMTGDHRSDIVGEYMKQIHDDRKLPENDKDVVIEDDVWVGCGVIILKGCRIGRGSIIAAGAVVVKDVPPYTIYISKDKSKPRFSQEQIAVHEKLLREKYPEEC